MEAPTEVLTNRAIGAWFHLFWEVWVIVANCAALVVSLTLLLKIKQAKQTNLTVFSMAICDLSSGVITLAFHLVSGGDFGNLTSWQCTVNATLLVFLAMQSLLLVLLLGVVRYRILIQKPLSLRMVKILLGALWVVCLAYALFVALMPGLVAPSPSRYYCMHRFGHYDAATTFATLIAALFSTTPAIVLLVCYVRVFRKMKVIEAAAATTRYSQAVAYMGFTVVLVYTISIMPWSLQIIYRLFAPSESEIPADVDAVFSIMVHTNYGINPVLYFVFKRDYMELVYKWFRCGSSNDKGSQLSKTTVTEISSKRRSSRSMSSARPTSPRLSNGSVSKARGVTPHFNNGSVSKARAVSRSYTETKTVAGHVNLECGFFSGSAVRDSMSSENVDSHEYRVELAHFPRLAGLRTSDSQEPVDTGKETL